MQSSTIAISLFVFGIAICLGTYAGTRTRRALPAFFVAWITTPVMGFISSLLVVFCSSVTNSVGLLLLLEMPIIDIDLVLIADITKILIVRRLQQKIYVITANSVEPSLTD